MGWSDCGTDSAGRPIGYGHKAKCDHTGCERDIDRGLDYACGGVHLATNKACEGYFCYEHLRVMADGPDCIQLCIECSDKLDDDQEE